MDYLSNQVKSLSSKLESQVKYLDSERVQDAEHEEISGVIDRAKDYIQQGLIVTARTILREIKHESTQLPPSLRARYLTNIAFCELSEDRLDEAICLVKEAYKVQPDNPACITNASLAARLELDHSQGLEFAQKALAINPDDPIAAANLISSLWELGQIDSLEYFVKSNEWILSNSDSAEALAKIRIQQDRYDDAEAIYRSFVEDNSNDHHVYVGLSQCLFARAQNDRIQAMYSEELKEILSEAESMAGQAVELLHHTQFTARRCEALLLRACARTRLEKLDEAMHDTDSVLIELPENENAIQQKGILLLKKGQPAQARSWLEKIQNSGVRDESLLPFADACLESNDAKTAVSLLKDSLSLDPPEWEDLGRAQTLMRAESELGCDDSVGPELEAALRQYPCDPILFVLLAVLGSLKNDTKTTISAIITAINLADGSLARMLQAQLGRLYVGLGQFSDAAEQFGKACREDVTHPDAIPMLLSLFNSGQYLKALNIVRRFHEEMDSLPREVLDVEANILAYVGDAKATLLCYRELCSRADSVEDDLAGLAKAQYRNGDYSESLKTIAQIDASRLCHEPHTLMHLHS